MWDMISGDLKYYWMLAIFGTAIFFIQMILTFFIGVGGDHDVDGDGDVGFGEHADTGFGDFRLFSFRSIMAFITFFGWGGVLFGGKGFGGFFAALASGLSMMFLTALGVFYLLKLQQSGNIYPEDMVGKSGTVYFKIPAGRIEAGKVTVSIGGGTREVAAVSDEEIPTGASVKVVQQIDGKRFLVQKI